MKSYSICDYSTFNHFKLGVTVDALFLDISGMYILFNPPTPQGEGQPDDKKGLQQEGEREKLRKKNIKKGILHYTTSKQGSCCPDLG